MTDLNLNVSAEAQSWDHVIKGRQDIFDVFRLVQAIFGIACAVAALSLWVLPGSSFALDLMAVKGAFTAALIMLAALLWQASRRQAAPEVHIDFVRSEVRVMEREGREERLKRRYGFAELTKMDVEDGMLTLVAPDGQILAMVPIDMATEAALRA